MRWTVRPIILKEKYLDVLMRTDTYFCYQHLDCDVYAHYLCVVKVDGKPKLSGLPLHRKGIISDKGNK